MYDPTVEAEIRRLFHAESWSVGTIAKQLVVHHSVVRRVLGLATTNSGSRKRSRKSEIDDFRPMIAEILKECPTLRASVLFRMAKKRGYSGGPDHFRHLLATMRPRRVSEAFLRLSTLPGAEAQVDWGSFGKIRIGEAERALSAFVMVLSHSRKLFVHFFPSMAMPFFLLGHVLAFDHFGGVPRTLLYDNLKSAVIMRSIHATVFNPELLALASHYHFEPKACRPRRGNEKGRVERAIRYLRDAFFAGIHFRSLTDLNREAAQFLRDTADERPWQNRPSLKVHEAFREEIPSLIPLPTDPYPVEERVIVRVGKTPYVRFDRNDYSVPHQHVKSVLVVLASETRVRILDQESVVAEHARTFDAGRLVENPDHVAAVLSLKRRARKGYGLDRLRRAVPQTQSLLAELAARGQNVGSATKALLSMLDIHGADALKAGVEEALRREVFHPHGVRYAIEKRKESAGEPPCLPLSLPDDPRVRDLVVRPADLQSYRIREEG